MVVDAGNGMGGYTVPVVLDGLPLEVVPLYFELDGSFPNHEANPLDPANLVDLQAAVREHGADIGLAFDGDADRVFVVDERGEPVSPSAITALVAVRELAKGRGTTIIHNLITSHAVPEIVREHGGRAGAHPRGALVHQGRDGPHRRRLRRRALRALLLPRLLARRHRDARRAARARRAGRAEPAAVGADRRLQPLRRLGGDQLHRAPTPARPPSGSGAAFADEDGVHVDELDGLTVELPDGAWFNLRASNTEPLLRLNVEAPDEARMARLRDRVLEMVRA